MSARAEEIDVWKSNLSVAKTVGPNIFRLFQFNTTKTLTLSLNFGQVQRERVGHIQTRKQIKGICSGPVNVRINVYKKNSNLRHSWQHLMDPDLLDYQTFWEQSASFGPFSAMESLGGLALVVIAWHVWRLVISGQCVGPGGQMTTEDRREAGQSPCGGCTGWPRVSLEDAASHPVTHWLTPSLTPLSALTLSHPVTAARGRAGTREHRHLAANDNIDST